MDNIKSTPLSATIEKLESVIAQYEQKLNDLNVHQESDTDLWNMTDIAGYLKFGGKVSG
jgi:hypothetical protein